MFPKIFEIEKIVSDGSGSNFTEFKIVISSNIVFEPFELYLKYLARQCRWRADVRNADFNTVYSDTVGGNSSLFGNSPDCVIIMLHLPSLCPSLSLCFSSLTDKERIEHEDWCANYSIDTIKGLRSQTKGTIIFMGFESPVYPQYGIYDSQMIMGQKATINRINQKIVKTISTLPNTFFLDMDLCLMRIGAQNFYDHRLWHMNRAPYSKYAFQEIANETFKFIRSANGQSKKCLVLDCDNILWGGIIGEDGINGIHLGPDYPGSAYYGFQNEILNLSKRGIIIALCSKNEEPDVLEVFKGHPYMILKDEHIAAKRINWNDKAANIRELAQELNIGLDSMVFVDDSEFEIGLIGNELPEVTTLHFEKSKAAWFANMLAGCGLFEMAVISEEDRKRSSMYTAEADRKKLQTAATDMNSYYVSLEMIVTIESVSDMSLSRVAQQTQKTNQFNLRTVRYSDVDITRFMSSNRYHVFTLHLTDKFGDSGIVGSAIIEVIEDIPFIDTFLLSCRALGRGIEIVFLRTILNHFFKLGFKRLRAEFIPSVKNAQTSEFYPNNGFRYVKNKENGTMVYEIDLNAEVDFPPYFRKIVIKL